MNTFFDKLTNAETREQTPETATLAASRASLRSASRKSASQHSSLHLNVATEENEARASEAPAEEEGELTVDIYDKGDSIVIQSTVAGVRPEDLDISITNDTVTIRGKRMCQDEVSEGAYYYKELFWGAFSRSVILPEEIEEDAAEASLKHGRKGWYKNSK
ncbi:MAG: HSP20 family protein [Parcubacteria group bacterium Gr01-1014_33]|nr:MAG: HSP20 family protein [Parcubacteria group bacterium Gr01-1014_33]